MKRIALLLLVAVSLGCSDSKTLSRSRAQATIDNALAQVKLDQIPLTAEDVKWGEDKGYWKRLDDTWTGRAYELTPKGLKAFKPDTGQEESSKFFLTLANSKIRTICPIGTKVDEITGIANASNASEKVVEYKIRFSVSCGSSELEDFFKARAKPVEKLDFKLYDDGWRPTT